MLKAKQNSLLREIATLKYFLRIIISLSKKYVLAIFLHSVMLSVLPFIAIFTPKYLIDELLGLGRIQVMATYIAAAVLINFILTLVSKKLGHYIKVEDFRILSEIEAKTGNLLMNIPFEHLEDPKFIDLKERAMFPIYTRNVLYELIVTIPKLIRYGITFVGTLAIICTFDVWIIVIILGLVLLNSFLNLNYQKKEIELQKDYTKINKAFVYYADALSDFSIGKDVRIYDASGFLSDKSEEVHRTILKGMAIVNRNKFRFEGMCKVIAGLQAMFVYGYIALQTIKSFISIGSFTMYISAATTFSDSVSKMFETLINLRYNCRYLEDYVTLNETPVNVFNGKETVNSENINIEFRNVSFRYPSTETNVLENISFKVSKNESISIVGKNGSGKSTIIKLLSRLYTPDQGEILVGGVNINQIDYAEYIKLISVVFQDFKLFDFSVAENMIFDDVANDEVNKDMRIELALQKAGVWEDICKLPNRIQSYVGKSFDKEGVEFSGGQMQKLAIARAVYKNSPIVILDEPTAALDPLSEAEIYKRFHDLISDKLAIYISHRLSSCKFCDKIIFIQGGKVAEEGTHEQLILTNGQYAEMFNLQANGYLD